jgi:UDP-glucose 4-epimerase
MSASNHPHDEIAAPFRGSKALVTGGLGFIGSTLARRLADAGAEVTVVDSLVPEYGGNRFNLAGYEGKIRVNISDVRDAHSLRELMRGQEFLFNLAGQTSHLDSMRDPFTDLEINCRAQLSILEVCREVQPDIKVVFASTRQLYGKPDFLPVSEAHLLRPVDVNGVNKMAGEWYHILYNNVYGIRACALRLTNTIGPRMRVKDARQTFLGIWVRLLLQGKPFEVWEGAQLRDFTYVEDAVDAFLLAASKPGSEGQTINLGGSEPVSLSALAEMMVRVNGGGSYELKSFPEERKRIDIGDYYSDATLAGKLLGWHPATPLEDAIGRTLAFYREHLPRYL